MIRWNGATVALGVVLIVSSAAAQQDKVCKRGEGDPTKVFCSTIGVRSGIVHYVDESRDVELGKYVATAQEFVPTSEVPVRALKSGSGWRVVLSVYLNRDTSPGIRIRFLDPAARLILTEDAQALVIAADIGRLFGDENEIVAITTEFEHSYNDETSIWLLPPQGKPESLLEFSGGWSHFVRTNSGRGVVIARQTYDGVDSRTKGLVREFYAWNSSEKTLQKARSGAVPPQKNKS